MAKINTDAIEPPASVATEQLMYIGPNIIDPIPLSHRSVYLGGIPEYARELTTKDPDFAGCFIRLAEAAKILRELEGYPGTKPGEHSRRYHSVQKRYQKESK